MLFKYYNCLRKYTRIRHDALSILHFEGDACLIEHLIYRELAYEQAYWHKKIQICNF